MSRRHMCFLIAGCALLLALELPNSVRTLREDLRGPYASCGAVPATLARRAEPIGLQRVPPMVTLIGMAIPLTIEPELRLSARPARD